VPVRVGVLPRELAARIINGTVATIGWAVGALTILLAVPVLIETLIARGRADDIPLPLALLMIILLGIAAVARWPRPEVVLVYLAVAGVATVGYELILLDGDPAILDEALFLVNRPTLALVAVGVTAATALSGILWSSFGLAVATGVSLTAALIAGVPFRPGLGPLMVYVVAVVGYLTFAAIQNAQRRRVPNFDELEAETQRLARGEDLSRRTTAAVHDTVLNDLSIVMNTTDTLDERVVSRLLEDLEQLRSAEWISQTTSIPSDDEDASLRNEIMRMVSDFQWRGLSIHVTGYGTGVYKLDPDVARALVGSVSAAFENVLRHSGAKVAELEVIYSDDVITIMVSDQGEGFDLSAVAPDRLGVRGSIVDRMDAVGGSARIWSSPGSGTTVMLSVPVLEVIEPQPESPHRTQG
jgi:hypothetical protein